MYNRDEIGKRIKAARLEKHLSQIKFAELINVSTPYLSDIENGKTNLSLEIFVRIVEALQVSADWLIMADTPQTFYKELERNQSSPSLELYYKICRNMHISADSCIFPQDRTTSAYNDLLLLISQCSESDLNVLCATARALIEESTSASKIS